MNRILQSTSCEALLLRCLRRIESKEVKASNAFLSLAPNAFYNNEKRYANILIQQARESDIRWAEGKPLSPVDGMPISIKDMFCVEDWKTTAGSRFLENFVSPYNSAVAERLLKGGALMIGKTNMDEFGMGSFGLNSYFGHTTLPGRDAVIGGSSSGSASAVAQDACVASIGTDTGGSVRLPAAFCNLVGFKPSYGSVSRWGLISYASSLDVPGVLAKNVDEAMAVMDVIMGPDCRDATCSENEWNILSQEEEVSSLIDVKVGIPREFFVEEIPRETLDIWNHASNCFSYVKSVSIPSMKHALPAYYVIASAEAASNLSRYDGIRYGHRTDSSDVSSLQEEYTATRSEGFGAEVKRRLLMGCYALSTEAYDSFYCKAVAIRDSMRQDFAVVFKSVDILVVPVTAFPAPKLSEMQSNQAYKNPVDAYLSDCMTVPASLAGLPSISIPVNTKGDSIQLIAAYGNDRKLLRIAKLLRDSFVL